MASGHLQLIWSSYLEYALIVNCKLDIYNHTGTGLTKIFTVHLSDEY